MITIIAGERGRNKRVHVATPLSTLKAIIATAVEAKPHAAQE